MNLHDVAVVCDVFCDWEGLPPRYRAYVNNELFTERTWIWSEEYLEELFQIRAPIGVYSIKYELIPPFTGNITVKQMHLRMAPAGSKILKDLNFRIGYAST